jgi:hypothetical protein
VIDYVLELWGSFQPTEPEAKSRWNLRKALTSHHLLFLGVNFDDWLMRFVFHLAREQPYYTDSWKSAHDAYMVEPVSGDSLVYFVSAAGGQTINAVEAEPTDFVTELYQRWRTRFGQTTPPELEDRPQIDEANFKQKIFISFATEEDGTAAEEIRSRLINAGCEVWNVQNEMKSGENYDSWIESTIKNRTCVFISVVSRTTVNKGAGRYFRVERAIAHKTDLRYQPDRFYISVVVEEGLDYREVKRTEKIEESKHIRTFVDGDVAEAFVNEMLELYTSRNRHSMSS